MKAGNTRASVLSRYATIAAIALFPVSAAHATLVENGGFETGDFSGWVVISDFSHGGCQLVLATASLCGGSDIDPGSHGGSFAAYLGQPTGYDPGSLSQSIPTVLGQTYTLDFWLANLSLQGVSTPNDFDVSWNGTTVMSFQDRPAFGYSKFTIPGLIATGTIATLQFTEHQNPAGFVLDDISVISSVAIVPEPDLSVLLGIGLLGLAWIRIQRKRQNETRPRTA